MIRDNRGGYNRKQINENFFKVWSPHMAYVLGFLTADGAIEDVDKSSRTRYVQFSSKDLILLEQIKGILLSTHKIQAETKPRIMTIRGKSYKCSGAYSLRIGNKIMFQDLINLGITPRKSLRLTLPTIPKHLFKFFLRGYFDGDGCVYTSRNKRNYKRIQVIFTSGSQHFLEQLADKIGKYLCVFKSPIYNFYAYRLRYSGKSATTILSYMYSQLLSTPFLERKYQKYVQYLE